MLCPFRAEAQGNAIDRDAWGLLVQASVQEGLRRISPGSRLAFEIDCCAVDLA
jgi:hypothetical protein